MSKLMSYHVLVVGGENFLESFTSKAAAKQYVDQVRDSRMDRRLGYAGVTEVYTYAGELGPGKLECVSYWLATSKGVR